MNQQLESAISRLESQEKLLGQQSSKISRWRLFVFLASAVVPYLIFSFQALVAEILLVVGILSFFYLIGQHRKVRVAQLMVQARLVQTRHRNAKASRNWQQMPSPYIDSVDFNHPYAKDLNLFGDKSLHRLIDSSQSELGSKKLAHYFTQNEPSSAEISWRQKQIKAFRSMLYNLDKIRIGLHLGGNQRSRRIELEGVLGWVSRESEIPSFNRLTLLIVLGLVSLVMLIVDQTRMVFPLIWVAYIFFYSNTRKSNPDGFWHLEGLSEKLKLFSTLYKSLSSFTSKNDPEAVKRLQSEEGNQISKRIVWISTMMSVSQSNPITFLMFNAFFPWDLVADVSLEKLRLSLKDWLPKWLDYFAEFEALYSLAEFSMLHPDYEFPEISPTERFSAVNLKHCMISPDESVGNTVEFKADGELFLITGSNMAGKSTFLRTLGTSIILANSGSVVAGKNVVYSPYQLFSSMGVGDSVTDGISFFYAEVKRLKSMMDWLKSTQQHQQKLPALILIDEIFKGTNNRERFEGSRSIILQLVGLHGVAFVSTHDLDLASLDKQDNRIYNRHFRETIEDDKMVFSYKIHDGPCPTTNALKIMEMNGLI